MRKGEVAHRYNPHPLLLFRLRTHGRPGSARAPRSSTSRWRPARSTCSPPAFTWTTAGGTARRGTCSRSSSTRSASIRRWAKRPVASTSRRACRCAIRCSKRSSRACAGESTSGCTSGRLFAEGLSLALLARLRECYGSARHAAPGVRSQALDAPVAERDRLHRRQPRRRPQPGVARQAAVDEPVRPSPGSSRPRVGATPHSFVLSRRLQRAEILLDGDRSLSEIALLVGFASQSHFTEAFRRCNGRTPS